MHHWRLSKYDPRDRDRRGAFKGEEWTSVSDIGHTFRGRLLTAGDYLRVEDAYVCAIEAFVQDADLRDAPTVLGLETYLATQETLANLGVSPVAIDPATIQPDQQVASSMVGPIARLNLRELIWCELAWDMDLRLRWGYDFYAYVASKAPSARAIARAESLGLFVETIDCFP